jgi:hypothetical protein
MKKQTPESELLHLCLDYLAAERIFSLRMNTGVASYGERKVVFGIPGTADVLAFPKFKSTDGVHIVVMTFIIPLWLEFKAGKGKQSELQKSFQSKVEGENHKYAVIRSLEDLKAALA